MKRMIAKLLLGATGLAAVALVALGATVQLRWDRTFDVPFPDVTASTDPAVVERGRYLAYGPAHCAYCHTTLDQMPRIDAGEQPPLAGGFAFRIPLGTFYSPNLTPDPQTGIGRVSDGALARMLRHNVRSSGRAAIPFMEFQNLSDEDVAALISFLRSQEPVHNPIPNHELTLLGKALMAAVIAPSGPAGDPPAKAPPEGPTIERGGYLANVVANCAGCHTVRDLKDGSYIGPRFAGGFEMEVDGDPSRYFVTPNLTPDPETGVLAGWTEDQFVARFRAGKVFPESHMPWGPFGQMSDNDLRAIFRYLGSLEPVRNETGPSLRMRS